MPNMDLITSNMVGLRLGRSIKKISVGATRFSIHFFLIEAILIYGMYLMVQLPHLSLFQIFILLVNLIFLLVAPLTFAVYLKLQVHFDLSYLNSLKLSFIGAFLDIRAVTKFLLGTFLLGVVTHFVPALFFFVLLGLWHFFVNDIFQPVYETIRSKVVS